jgi:hypothetical protein
MKLLTILAVFTCFMVGGILFAGQNKKTVDAWLEEKHAQLSTVADPSSIRKVSLAHSDKPNKDGYFSLYPKSGYLEFADGNWVLLTSHSVHAEDGLPDISLIRTSTGEYYTNRGHCCLPILLFSKSVVGSLEDFLKTTGKGAKAEATPWIKYNREQDGTGQPATRSQSKSEGSDNPQPEAEGRSR